jgi:hypothetical protein
MELESTGDGCRTILTAGRSGSVPAASGLTCGVNVITDFVGPPQAARMAIMSDRKKTKQIFLAIFSFKHK